MPELYLCRLSQSLECELPKEDWGKCGNCKLANKSILNAAIVIAGPGKVINAPTAESDYIQSVTLKSPVTQDDVKITVTNGDLATEPL